MALNCQLTNAYWRLAKATLSRNYFEAEFEWKAGHPYHIIVLSLDMTFQFLTFHHASV